MESDINYLKPCKYNSHHNSYCSNCSRDDFQAMAERTLDMKREEDRLRTYGNWNYEHIQNPRLLAKAGLYYTGIDDRVQCPFCHGVLKKWEPSDIPYNEHSAHFSYCRFIRGYDVGNVPIEGPSPVNYYNTRSTSNNIGNHTHIHSNNVINNNDVNCNNTNFHNGTSSITPAVNIIPQLTHEAVPDLKEYLKTEFNRLRTFSTWPPNLPQTPETLSEAGFYHVPTDEKPDRVKCAYCQGKLFNWQENDDPWIEHARCFPNCPYVGLCMGKDVVRELLANEEPEVPIENSCNENGHDVVPAQPPPPTQLPTQPAPEGQTTDDNVAVRMTSEPVQAVLEMGFDNDLVTQTVEKCLRERPGNFPPAEELASMVMELEEELSAPAEAAAPLTPLQRMVVNGRRGENGYQPGAPETPEQRTKAFEATQMNNVARNGKMGGQNGTSRVNVDRIRSENSKMKDQLLCKICMENLVRVTFMPCGHLVCCGPCSMTMSECPICRASITGCVRTYF